MSDGRLPSPFATDGRLHERIATRFAHPAALASLLEAVLTRRNVIAIGAIGSGRRALLLALDEVAAVRLCRRPVWATPDGVPDPKQEIREARELLPLLERLYERGLDPGDVAIADADADAWREIRPDITTDLVQLATDNQASLVLGVKTGPDEERSYGRCEGFAAFAHLPWEFIRVDKQPLTHDEAVAWLRSATDGVGARLLAADIEVILRVATMRGSLVPSFAPLREDAFAPMLLACAAAAVWELEGQGGPDIAGLVERRDRIWVQSFLSPPARRRPVS